MQLQQFARKPLVVEGVQVTDENIEEVAKWCGGEINTEPKGKHIKVKVQNPLTQRQTKAFVGDWVLSSNRGFKVYTSAGLQNAFDMHGENAGIFRVEPDEHQTVRRGNIFDAPQELLTTDQPVSPHEQISGSSN